MPRLASIVCRALALVAAAALVGCAPDIGDKCQTSVDCSQTGDRLCDTTMPEGYCTIFNCEPDTCPASDDAVCVAFDADLDPACGVVDDTRTPRFQRSFCMATCEDASDCRSGYVCADPTDPRWRGAIVDHDPVGKKVCIVDTSAPVLPAKPPEACYPPDAVFDLTPYDGGGGAGGAGGASSSASSSASSAGGAGGATSASSAGGAGGAPGTGGAGGTGGT